MLTVKKAAEKAGVSPGLVYVWVESGVLTHYRMGKPGRRGSIRVAQADLDAYLASLKHGESKASVPSTPQRKVVLKHLRLKHG